MRSHKGPRSSGKPQRHQKQSQVRCAALFKSNPALDVPLRVMHALPMERSMDRRTAQQVAMVVPWAQTYVKRFPYKPPAQRSGEARSPSDLPLNTAGGRDASAVSSSPTEVASPLTPVHLYLPYSLPSASLSRFEVPSCLDSLPHCPPSDISMQSPSTPLIEGDRTPAMDIDPSPLDHCPTSLAPSCEVGFVQTRSLTLANGEMLTFTSKDVPDPAYIKFNKDIRLLASMWDDASSAWGGVSFTTIHGHPIPLKFWPTLYRYWKPAIWKAKKGEWSKWKTIATRYLQGTPEEFNAAFTVNGQLQSYTAIEKAITQAHVANDQELSAKAHEEYGADFDRVFLYRRTRDGARIVMSKDSSIAHHYRCLQGEAQEDEEGDSDEGI